MVKKFIIFSTLIALVFFGSLVYSLSSPKPVIIKMSTFEGFSSPSLNITYHFPPLEEGEGCIFELDGEFYMIYGTQDGPKVEIIPIKKGILEANGVQMRNLPLCMSPPTGMVPPR